MFEEKIRNIINRIETKREGIKTSLFATNQKITSLTNNVHQLNKSIGNQFDSINNKIDTIICLSEKTLF